MAITAVARKLVTIAYLKLKNNEPYRYARPELMNKKFAKLRGTGREPDKAPPAPRPRTKAKEGLEEVYRSAQLPAVTTPEGLPAGERRMLAERGLEGFVRGLYEPAGPPARRADPGREAGGLAMKSRATGRQAVRPNGPFILTHRRPCRPTGVSTGIRSSGADVGDIVRGVGRA